MSLADQIRDLLARDLPREQITAILALQHPGISPVWLRNLIRHVDLVDSKARRAQRLGA